LGSSSESTPDEYGSRSSGVRDPVVCAIAIWVWAYSIRRRQAGSSVSRGWVNECTPSSWPSATSCRVSSGWRATWEPTTKKVARTECRRSTRMICGVHSGSGPSSKVSAIRRAGMWYARAASPLAWTSGPPSRTRAGTDRRLTGAARSESGANRALT
jgi:hypothetical protein